MSRNSERLSLALFVMPMINMKICAMLTAAQAELAGQVTLTEILRLLQVLLMPGLSWNASSRWSGDHMPTYVPIHGSKGCVTLGQNTLEKQIPRLRSRL